MKFLATELRRTRVCCHLLDAIPWVEAEVFIFLLSSSSKETVMLLHNPTVTGPNSKQAT